MIKRYWVETLLVSLWITAILNIRANIGPEHDSLGYIEGGKCFLREILNCATGREPVYRLFLALLLTYGGDLVSTVPIVQNILFLLALLFYVFTCFGSGKLARYMVVRISLLVALIPTFLVVLNGSIYTESISASFTLIQLGLVVRFIRSTVFDDKTGGVARNHPWAELLAISVIAGASFLIKGSFFYVQIFFGASVLSAILAWKLTSLHRVRLLSSISLIICLTGSPLIYFYGWSLFQQPDSINGTFGRGGAILYGHTEYVNTFNFRTDSHLFLADALSESGCITLFGRQCEFYGWQQEYYGRDFRGWDLYRLDDYYTRVVKPRLTDSEYLWLGKRNLVQKPFLQLYFMLFAWSRFIFHHTTTGFASLTIPIIGAIVTSFWFILLLKFGNLAIYAGLFWLLRWRDIQSKPELIIPILFFVAYLLPYGLAATVVRMIYPVAPLLVLILADLALRRWRIAKQLLE